MGSYIIIPILILLVLLTLLPQYLEDYFVQAKEEELLDKGEMVTQLLSYQQERAQEAELSELLMIAEDLVDTSLLLVNKESEIINQGIRMQRMMKEHHGGSMREERGDMRGRGRRESELDFGFSEQQEGDSCCVTERLTDLESELEKALTGERVSFRSDSKLVDESIIGVAFPLSTEVALFLISPVEGLQETVLKVRNLTLQVTLGAVFLALLLGYFISKGISQPVKEMKIKAQQMAGGNFATKIENLPGDEIGELGESFNYLSARLSENINALNTEKSRMRSMLNSMGEGVLGVSVERKVLLANPRLKKIFDIEAEILEQAPASFLAEELIDLTEAVLTEKEELKEEFEWQDKVILAHGAPVKKSDDSLWGAILLVRDLTQIRKLDQMRRLFVANVSHELKTPLTAIQGYLEAILDGLVEDVELQRDYLQRVLSETDRMTRLVTDILDLAQLQSGQIEFELEKVKLTSLIESVVVNLESELGKREVIIEGEEELIIETDYDRLQEVFINLLSNAIKFTETEGKIEISITGTEEEVEVKIIDNGIGISDSELPYIWERFHQVDRARGSDKQGTGLGLAIVKEIIEGLNAKIEVASEEGVGTEFKITLPKVVK